MSLDHDELITATVLLLPLNYVLIYYLKVVHSS